MALPADASLLLRFDDTSTLWQDTGGSTAASANGATVQRIDDMSGNGYNATLVSGATAGVLATAKYGAKSVTCNGTAFTLGQPSGLVTALNGNACTVFAFFRPSLYSTQCFVFGKGAGGGARYAHGFLPGVTPGYQQWTILSTATSLAGWGYETTQPHTYAHAFYASEQVPNQRLFIAGAAVANTNTATPKTADTTNDVQLGGAATGSSYRMTGDLLAVYVYSRSLSPLEILTLSDYCYSHWSVANPRLSAPYQLVFSGNSLCTIAGYIPLPERLRRQLGLPLGSVHNLAIGGQTNGQMTTDDPTRVDPLLSSLSNPLLCGWEASNDANATNYQTWVTARRTAGWPKAMVATVLSRSSISTGARATLNTAIRGYTSAAGVYVTDPAANPYIGYDSAYLDTALFPDNLHFAESASEPFVAPTWASSIRSLMVPSGTPTSKSGQRRRVR